MRTPRTLARTAAAVLTAFALATAACGGDDDDDAEPAPEQTTEQTAGGEQTGDTAADDSETGDTGTAATTAETDTGGDDAPAPRGGTLTIASAVDNNTYDTKGLTLGNHLQYWMPLYDTLLWMSPEGELEPNMATEWSYNDDNTVLTLTLQDGITFTDGEPFNAEAVKANMEYLRDGGGPFSSYVAAVEEVVPVDELTAEVRLTSPDPALLYGLAVVGGAMASPAAIAAGTLATSPVGSGAYTLDGGATTPGTEYVYQRNPDYWNPDAYAYDTIVIKPILDLQARLNAIQSGQADTGLLEVSNADAAADAGIQIDTTSVNWEGLVIADRAGEVVPALGDVRVRQAINMAFDKDAIVENVIAGRGTTTTQVFGPNSDAYVAELDEAYANDVEAAQALMEEAGYGDGFEITMPETNINRAMNPIIVQQLGQIGIAVNYESVPPDSVLQRFLAGDFPMYFMRLGSQSPGEDIQKMLTPTSPWNTSKTDDPELAALVEEAATATPGEEQTAAFQAVNEWVVDNAWFAPLYRPEGIIASDPSVDVTPNALYTVPFPRHYQPAS